VKWVNNIVFFVINFNWCQMQKKRRKCIFEYYYKYLLIFQLYACDQC
jgi:hypothetical protein